MAKFKVNVDSGLTLKDGSFAPVYAVVEVDPREYVTEVKSERLIPVTPAPAPPAEKRASLRFLADDEK